MKDLIARAKTAGFNVLVVTLDIAVGAKRNRELKNGLKLPFKFTPKIVWEAATHPDMVTEYPVPRPAGFRQPEPLSQELRRRPGRLSDKL